MLHGLCETQHDALLVSWARPFGTDLSSVKESKIDALFSLFLLGWNRVGYRSHMPVYRKNKKTLVDLPFNLNLFRKLILTFISVSCTSLHVFK